MTYVAAGIVSTKPKVRQRPTGADRLTQHGANGRHSNLPPNGFGGRGDGRSGRPAANPPSSLTGMLLLLAGITMLFMAFTSAFLVRSTDADWRQLATPSMFWWSTGVILLSSFTLEQARRVSKRGEATGTAKTSMVITALLGLAFVASQFGAWRQLSAAGFHLAWGPHSSFIYLLSAVHLLHVLGGIIFLLSTTMLLWRNASLSAFVRRRLDMTALYWHFVGGLWLYVFALLFAF